MKPSAPIPSASLPPSGPREGPQSSDTLASLRRLAWWCVVLPLLLYAAVGSYRYTLIRAETDVRLDRALKIAREHALKVLDTNEVLLARATDTLGDDGDDAIGAREEALHQKFRAMLQGKPQLRGIWVQDARGRPLVSSQYYPVPAQVSVVDRDYFRWHRDNPRGGVYVDKPFGGKMTGDRVLNMSIGRYAPDGSFIGLVSVSLLTSYFEQFHRDLAADEPGLAINMLREDGSIYSRWPPLPNAPANLSASSPVMTRIRAGDHVGNTSGVSSVDGRERLLLFGKVGDYPVFLGTGMDVSNIAQRWLREMAWLAAFGLPPLLGLLVVLRMALRRTREALHSAEQLNHETLALRRVEEALLQAQKLEALGRLTGGVAHDFNNALMVISNNVFILKRKLLPGTDNPQLESISRAVGSATKLTRQLLAFSRRQALVPELVRLQTKLPPLRDLLGPVLGSQVELRLDVAPDTLPIHVDSAEFELALINLAINARDAMPAGGSFTVRARNAGGDLPPLLTGPMVLVEASDTGAGVAPEVLDKVFEPFFTTKPVGHGTGLGLSQVYALCQRAGGVATMHSSLGGGATVRLYFPPAPDTAVASDSLPSQQQRQLGKKVLLVEDNDEVAVALVPVLESLGCLVVRMDRGAAARDWLRQQSSLPDVMLSDVIMPGEMDGMALAQHVRATYPQVDIVLMTGYTEQLDTISRQGFEILPKPCSADMLAQAMTRGRTGTGG